MADEMNQDAVAQILEMIGQLSPEQMQALLSQLEGGGEQEQAPAGMGTVSPEGGVGGVPIK